MRSISTIVLEIPQIFNSGIPLKVYSVAQRTAYPLHYVCPKSHRITYKKFCPVCNKEVAYEDLKKGFSVSDTETIILDKEQLEKIKQGTKAIKFISLVSNEINPLLVEKSYYLAPDIKNKLFNDSGTKFSLLKDTLKQDKKAIMVKFSLRGTEHLGIIHNWKDMLCLAQIIYPERLNKPEFENYNYPKEYISKMIDKMTKLNVKTTEADLKDTQNEEIYKLIQENSKPIFEGEKKKQKPKLKEKADIFA